MNGHQIVNFLSLDPFTGPVFGGLAMQNSPELPFVQRNKVMYVLNTDILQGAGEHWCIVYFEGGKEEFFDPFGQSPNAYGFERLLNKRKQTKKCQHNTVCVQDLLGITCGAHCLFFGFQRCRGLTMREILALYDTSNPKGNDTMVAEFVLGFGRSFGVKQ